MAHARVPLEVVHWAPRALLVRREDAHLRVGEVLDRGPDLASTVAPWIKSF